MAIRRAARAVTVAAVGVLGLAVATPASSQPVAPPSEAELPPIERSADEQVEVVEVTVDGVARMDELVATGVDLDHHVTPTENGIVLHAVVTPSEQAALEARGFAVGRALFDEGDSEARVEEREATIAAHVEENEAFAAAAYDDGATAPDVSDVKIVRADYYTSFGNPVLSVEAKWAGGQGSNAQLTVERDSGPGTEFGSGGTQNISRFVDAGVYLYHRGASSVTTRPDRIRIVSPTGDVAIAEVDDWLPLSGEETDPSYQTGFITSYLTPTELYDRISQLAADFPDLAEVVELPYKTNGYRRHAQALLDPPGNRLVVDSPSPAAGTYGFAAASYGPSVPAAGVSGAFAVVDDGSALPTEGCDPLVGFPAGAIALVDRGTCPFVQKTQNAQDAGAIAVVIVNNVGGAPTSPGGSGTFAIPTVMISQADGNLVKANLPATGRLLPGASVSSASRVGVDSVAWGHEGGNDVTVQAVDPGVPDSPLTVGVSGQDITVTLATNSAGTRTSTAAQVRDALNADPAASALILAYTYRGSTGTGVVPATERIQLSDNLSAPDSVSREPHPVYALRIGKHRDGSKMGVLAYAQEHAREWVPPLVTIETAERLLRNYAQHGPTKQLLNNLDIWIAPSINPDGGHYSFYDFASQRRNMTRHCPVTGAYDVNARNAWGVDNNRNYDTYSLFDGYDGASTSCTNDVFAGPSELSEPESRNLDWLASQPNITFAMNLHSSGNYFMWSPGAYQVPGRISAPRPTLEEESFFWGASSRILTAIKEHRGLSVTPARTGPISDVLYSAAGNSGDMLWYKHGIYAWNFEVGTSFQPPFEGSPTGGSALQESQEFANGLVELMRVAYDYGKDRTRPESFLKVQPSSTPGKVIVTFETTEPAAVFYTLDGSVPTYESTLYGSAGIREGGEMLQVDEGTTMHWFSVDSAGNVERNYRPDGTGRNFGKGVAVLAP